MAGTGGKRKGAGRKPGVPNKVTADVRALAQKHAPAAIKELARLASKADSEAARVAAIKEILDRAYGKSAQPVGGTDELPAILHEVRRVIVDPRNT